MEVFENASQKRRFSKTLLIIVNAQKTEIFGFVFVIRQMNVNEKTDVFPSVFVQKWNNVNG